MLPVGNQALAITDSGAVPTIDPIVAEIVAEPVDTPVRRPVVGPIVAKDNVSEAQLARVVTVCVLPSEYVPVALSCWTIPTPASIDLGAIEIDSRATGATVSVVLPETAPDEAVITVVPTANVLESPDVVLIVALAGVPDV